MKSFEISTAKTVRNEHLNFVDVLCSSAGSSDEHFVLTFDKLRECKPVLVTSVVIKMLMVHTEALLFKCRLSQAAVQHALNWEANFGKDKKGHAEIAQFYRDNEVMDLMAEKARLVR